MTQLNKTLDGMDESAGRTVTIAGFWVNLFLSGAKLAFGLAGRSQAMIADAVHSISDLFTDAVVLAGLKAGRKQPDDKHHFGHGRIETLASSIVSIFLIGAAVGIGLDAGTAIYRHESSHPSWIALVGAGLSIVLKEVLYQYTMRVGKKIKSKALMANAWHHRSDAWSSIAVFAGVAGAQVNPRWHVLDSYAALLVSFLVLMVGVKMLVSAVAEFTDAAPDRETIEKIRDCIICVPGVEGMHDVKVRTSADLLQMQAHIVVDGGLTVTQGHRIAKQVEVCLFNQVENMTDVLIHVDPSNEKGE